MSMNRQNTQLGVRRYLNSLHIVNFWSYIHKKDRNRSTIGEQALPPKDLFSTHLEPLKHSSSTTLSTKQEEKTHTEVSYLTTQSPKWRLLLPGSSAHHWEAQSVICSDGWELELIGSRCRCARVICAHACGCFIRSWMSRVSFSRMLKPKQTATTQHRWNIWCLCDVLSSASAG